MNFPQISQIIAEKEKICVCQRNLREIFFCVNKISPSLFER